MCLCVCVHEKQRGIEEEGRGPGVLGRWTGRRARKGGLWEWRIPRVCTSPGMLLHPGLFHATHSAHLFQRNESQDVFVPSCASHLSLKHRASSPSLSIPSPSHGVSAAAFAMHPTGLSLALTLDFQLCVPHRSGSPALLLVFRFPPCGQAGCCGDEAAHPPCACRPAPPRTPDALGIALPLSSMSSLL